MINPTKRIRDMEKNIPKIWLFLNDCTHGKWRFPGQGLNLSHSCDPGYSSSTTRFFNWLHQAGGQTWTSTATQATAARFLAPHCTTRGTPWYILKIIPLLGILRIVFHALMWLNPHELSWWKYTTIVPHVHGFGEFLVTVSLKRLALLLVFAILCDRGNVPVFSNRVYDKLEYMISQSMW